MAKTASKNSKQRFRIPMDAELMRKINIISKVRGVTPSELLEELVAKDLKANSFYKKGVINLSEKKPLKSKVAKKSTTKVAKCDKCAKNGKGVKMTKVIKTAKVGTGKKGAKGLKIVNTKSTKPATKSVKVNKTVKKGKK